jgi:hypothetical protein
MNKDNSIQIPEALLSRLLDHKKKTSFGSINDLVAFILQDYLDRQNYQIKEEKSGDDAEVIKRLQDLGYI